LLVQANGLMPIVTIPTGTTAIVGLDGDGAFAAGAPV